MAIDSSLIGKTSEPQTFQVTREAVQRFMEATEDPALQSGKPLEYAPPTFPTTFRLRNSAVRLDTSKMQLLHGEQAYTYVRPLRIGEEVTCVSRIIDVRQREGRSGPMTIMITELIGTDSNQQPVFTARGTSIIRTKS
ncbi:MAG TPA: MaoC family dehydratase N-terminal domain-containing protein [Ktedonobacteraceae bacterium]|nr:MaoC family dehydratase N-terminal domain-containing protein [Ktedonobacteraceae bacterium]